MQHQIVAAIFPTPIEAERAVQELRDAGVADELISVVASTDKPGHEESTRESAHESLRHDSKSTGVMKGVGAGGAVGALAGLVALAIPGLAPFIAAGALAEVLGVAGSAAVVSGTVGAAAGGLTAVLIDYGISESDAAHIERRLKDGAALVAVDTRNSKWDYAAVRAVLRAAGGEIAESEIAESEPAARA